jgi:single-stranded-DNA-specific exonuclease
MSILNKNWEILNGSQATLEEKLLQNRGLNSKEKIDKFLDPETHGGFHDPFDFPDMEKAVERIKKAVEKKERIIVFGDYDVDGITSVAILVKALGEMGANVSYRLPHRVDDGYGLKEKFVREFIDIGVGLVITVDCGISCGNEISLAKKNGIDVVITDHHDVPKIPPKDAYAILHPKDYKCKDLTGAGVAFKLASALVENPEKYLDLAAMGTVADIGILKGENRLIVKKGLKQLAETDFEGLNSLKEIAEIDDAKIDSRTIGFQLGPRINAAGRIDSPYFALQLLLNDCEVRGKKLAKKLDELNKKRQVMTQKAVEEADAFFADNNKEILIKEDKDWHVGILGLIAGRLTEKHGVPSIILQDFGEYLTASARSTENFNIIEALKEHASFLTYFGGHAQAAGFEIAKENYLPFCAAIETFAKENTKEEDQLSKLKIECEIEAEDITEKTLDFLETLKPFGAGNETPQFLMKDLDIKGIREVGKDNAHLRIKAKHKTRDFNIIAFRFGEYFDQIRQHSKIDLVCNIEKNPKNKYEKIQIRAVDINLK